MSYGSVDVCPQPMLTFIGLDALPKRALPRRDRSIVSVAAAVEAERGRMPKADLQLVTWDENRKLGGFQTVSIIGAAAGRQ